MSIPNGRMTNFLWIDNTNAGTVSGGSTTDELQTISEVNARTITEGDTNALTSKGAFWIYNGTDIVPFDSVSDGAIMVRDNSTSRGWRTDHTTNTVNVLSPSNLNTGIITNIITNNDLRLNLDGTTNEISLERGATQWGFISDDVSELSAILRLNGTTSYIQFMNATSSPNDSVIGVSHAGNSIITGSGAKDLCIRVNTPQSMRFSCDNGASTQLEIDNTTITSNLDIELPINKTISFGATGSGCYFANGASLLSSFEEGTISTTISAKGGASVAIDIAYSKINDLVTLSFKNTTMVSGSGTSIIQTALAAIPAQLRPTIQQFFGVVGNFNNTGTIGSGFFYGFVSSGGTITIQPCSGIVLDSFANQILSGQTITYRLGF